ncbi:MAG: TonB-dependent receptor [Flavobacteriales bacterium]|nr:TonB-dependent receptor [Flavobacteriales bacterium]
MNKQLLVLVLIASAGKLWSQKSIDLDEVVVTDQRLDVYSNTQSLEVINDSIIEDRAVTPMEMLQENTSIFFKENGRGMVASPSFRGTTASQTAVIWNGIPINSKLLGQTDFNLIALNNFDEIQVRSGGGSVAYGSDAVGGSVHLNNNLKFNDKNIKQYLGLNYGSFSTLELNTRFKMSRVKHALEINMNRNSSDNDFKFQDIVNQNGSYQNMSWSVNYAFRLNEKNTIGFYNLSSWNDRNLSAAIGNTATDRYENLNYHNLLQWTNSLNKLNSKFNLVYQNERFRYYTDGTQNKYTGNIASTKKFRYDAVYTFDNYKKLTGVFDYNRTDANGTSITHKSRNTISGALLWIHKPKSWLLYEVGIRSEKASTYKNPLLYSAGLEITPSNWFQLKINASKNYRTPTLNDLYWTPGGNTTLVPELSHQFEVSHIFSIQHHKLSGTVFYNDIESMIRWMPNVNLGYWEPQNIDAIFTKGFELKYGYTYSIARHQFQLNAAYSYTVSQVKNTGHQLSYVPFEIATGSLTYRFNHLGFNYITRYTGKVYTRSDESDFLEDYTLHTIRVFYRWGEKINYSLAFKINNLTDQVYMNVENRPTPGRNYITNFTIKF